MENLLLSGYDHVLDIRGLRRNRIVSAREIAVLKEFKDIIEMLDDWTHYQVLFVKSKKGRLGINVGVGRGVERSIGANGVGLGNSSK